MLHQSNIECAWSQFKAKLDELTNKHIPTVTIKSEFQPPWFDSETYNACREKERWRAKYKKSKNEEHYIKFSQCRRNFKKLVKQKMSDNIAGDEDTISKQFWKHVRATSNSHRIPEWQLW